MNHVKWECGLGPDKCSACNYDTHTELFICDVCGGMEASLPKECPGRLLTAEEDELIQTGKLDFHHNQWWTKA